MDNSHVNIHHLTITEKEKQLNSNITILTNLENDIKVTCVNSHFTCSARNSKETLVVIKDYENVTNFFPKSDNVYTVLTDALEGDSDTLSDALKQLENTKDETITALTKSIINTNSPKIPFFTPATSSKIYSLALPILILLNFVFVILLLRRYIAKLLRKCCCKRKRRTKYKKGAREEIVDN